MFKIEYEFLRIDVLVTKSVAECWSVYMNLLSISKGFLKNENVTWLPVNKKKFKVECHLK